MGIEYELDELTGVAVIAISGEFSFEDAINVRRALWGDPKYSCRLLVDIRSGLAAPRDADFFRQFAELVQKERPPSLPPEKTAYVVASDVDFGLSRMAQAYFAQLPVDIRVFRDLDEARTWLEEGL